MPFRIPICFGALVLILIPLSISPSKAAKSPFILGADLSGLKINEDAGIVYKDSGKGADCLQIFQNHGWNLLRLRLWVNPSGKNGIVNDLAYDASLARRAKAAGMKVMIDLHYSDSWADAGNQTKPKAWANDTFETPTKLYNDIYWYTSNVIYTLASQYHVTPDYIEIGNEVTYGILWPEGNLNDGHGGWVNWKNFATLLNQGILGAQRGATKAGVPMPKTIIHISLGKYWDIVDGFYSGLASARDIWGHPVQFDIIGLSYYPDNMTNLSDIKEVLNRCAAKFGKLILICETSYPYHNFTIAKDTKYPNTPEGQADYLADLIKTVRETPNGLGLGVCYWEPEALPNPISQAYANGSWRDSGWQALFDTETHAAQPAILQAGESLSRLK